MNIRTDAWRSRLLSWRAEMTEIPDHGRVIDADALIAEAEIMDIGRKKETKDGD